MPYEVKLPKDESIQLFPPGNFRLTDQSLFSTSPPDQSEIIKEILLAFYSKDQLKKMTYMDGTSNVGGNVFPIIPLVKKMIAVEIDELTSEILIHNIKEAQPDAKNTIVLNEDLVKFDFEKHKPDILLVDAPWGGKKYRELKDKELYLSGNKMSKLLMDIWVHYPDVILLKVPTQYPFPKKNKAKMGYFKQINFKNKSGRTVYKILVLAKNNPKSKIKTNYTIRAVPYKFFHPVKV